MVIKKGMEVSRLSGAESVVGQRGKFESYGLFNGSVSIVRRFDNPKVR